MTEPLEPLRHPPIDEVACGFIFPAIHDIDAMLLGVYQDQRRDDFPKKQLVPPITENSVIQLGMGGPMRGWLISQDDTKLLQIQSDRFYLNWRNRGHDYPRFKDYLLDKILKEFSQFGEFCSAKKLPEPKPHSVQLIKIDHLIEGKHWSKDRGIQEVLPHLADSIVLDSSVSSFAVRSTKNLPKGSLAVAIQLMHAVDASRILVETNCTIPVGGGEHSLRDLLIECDEVLNREFDRLIPREVRDRVFQSDEVIH